ncbi:MAG: hypothetical protein RJQ04_00020 [Longimicrobiales bacterium]
MSPSRLVVVFALGMVAPAVGGCTSTTVEASGPRAELRILQVMGEPRSYIAYAPDGVEPAGARVILLFHGADGTAEAMLNGTDALRIAEELDAVLAVPDANHVNWAEDCGCVNADIVHGVADTAFVSAILSDLKASVNADIAAPWVVGYSQGGMFAQRLACQMSGRWGGVAVIAATMSVPLAERCAPTRPVNLFMALSTTDPIFPWDGRDDGSLSTLGGPATAARWQALNGCDAPEERVDPAGRRYVYGGCDGGARIELLGVEPGSHSWGLSGAVDTALEVARFFGG